MLNFYGNYTQPAQNIGRQDAQDALNRVTDGKTFFEEYNQDPSMSAQMKVGDHVMKRAKEEKEKGRRRNDGEGFFEGLNYKVYLIAAVSFIGTFAIIRYFTKPN